MRVISSEHYFQYVILISCVALISGNPEFNLKLAIDKFLFLFAFIVMAVATLLSAFMSVLHFK